MCVALTALMAGCSDEPLPTSTWTPSDHAQPPEREVDPSRVPRAPEPTGDPTIRAATALWRVSCASCHGVEGAGNGPAAPSAMPDLRDPTWQRSRTDEQISSVIRLGRPPMPAFGDTLAPEGITALVQHVRRMSR